MLLTRTPYRISLFGGGSDHPVWYRENGGEVISFAIDKYCYLATKVVSSDFGFKYQISYSKFERTNSLEAIKHPVVREAIRRYCPNIRLQIIHDSDLPARSGVGSSSAFAVGLIQSLTTLIGKEMTVSELAQEAIHLEQNVLKENVGSQDQIACAFGGFNYITFGKDPDWALLPMEMSEMQLCEIERRVVLVYTGVTRSSSDVQKGLLSNLKNNYKIMNRNIDLARECKSIFINQDNMDEVGELLLESWHIKRELNPNSVNLELQEIWDKGIKAGALGGKVLGAGGGGFCLFWVRDGGREEFLQKFRVSPVVPIKISMQGSTCITNLQ